MFVNNKLESKITRYLFGIYSRLPGQPLKGSLQPIYNKYQLFKKKNKIVATIDGVTYDLDLSEYIDNSIYYKGCFEIEVTRAIKGNVKRGMTVLDIGANIGCHTFRLASLVGNDGLVIAFEPMIWAYRKLCRNYKLNSFKNIVLEKIGLGDASSEIVTSFRSSWKLDEEESFSAPEKVKIRRLDDYLLEKGIRNVDFIKCDVDGYEYKILRGAFNTLKDSRPIIVMEWSEWTIAEQGDCAFELLEYLEFLGYAFYLASNPKKPLQIKDFRFIPMASNTSINIICKSSGK